MKVGIVFCVFISATFAKHTFVKRVQEDALSMLRRQMDTFKMFDQNGDGFVTVEEMHSAAGGQATRGQIEMTVRMIDGNGDGKLSRAEYEQFERSMGKRDLNEVRRQVDAFRMMDQNGDGFADVDEVLEATRGQATRAQVEMTVRMIDTDRDGRISRSEYEIFESQMMGKRTSEPMRTFDTFSMFDQNGDGFATVDELISAAGGQATRGQIEMTVRMIDQNQDGKLSRSEYEIFESQMRGKRSLDTLKRTSDVFGLIDGDRDGFISVDEMLRMSGGQATRGQIEMTVRMIDASGDGKISRAEWRAFESQMGQRGPV